MASVYSAEEINIVRAQSAGRAFDLKTIAAGSNGAQVVHTGRASRVTLTIIGARNLKKKANGPDGKDPVFKLRVENTTRYSCELKSGPDHSCTLRLHQSFTFDAQDLQNPTVSLHVVGRGILGMEESLGCIDNMNISALMDESSMYNGVATAKKSISARWCDLMSKDGRRTFPGQVYIQIVAGVADPEQKISLFVGTWNVGNARPPKDLSEWIPPDPDYELVAIGAQECDYQPRHPFVECSKDWLHVFSSHLGVNYKLVHATSRGQMRLLVFVHEDAEKAISDIDSGSEATGVGHVMANKGGVCITFKFWDTSLCFVNTHFAAHAGQCESRNSNYREIAGQLRVGLPNMDMLNQFHHVFWLGDLNYRLDFCSKSENPLTPEKSVWMEVVKKIDSAQYSELLKYDELKREMSADRVLTGFKEGKIDFAPTFKVKRDAVNEYMEKRLPAWCDRILWRNLSGCSLSPEKYFSAPNLTSSDHKPVGATFKLTAYALPPLVIMASLEADDKRWHIQFTSLRAKKLRASDMNGFSDPYVSFVGPNLLHEYHSKVKHQTLNPVWNPKQELPILVLNMFPLRRLQREYLSLRVLDRDYTSSDDTLGYGVIPLAPAVVAFNKGPAETARFRVRLTHRGLPAGTLEGGMKLTWERNFARRRASTFVARTLNFRETFRKRVLTIRT